MRINEPVEVPLGIIVCAVYRLWAADGRCLYVGQTATLHPILRIAQHRSKPWWGDVARADYVEIFDASQLDRFEMEQIRQLDPVHNMIRAW